MTPHRKILLSLLTVVALGGCQTFAQPTHGDWRAVQAPKVATPHLVRYTHPVRFAPRDGVLFADQTNSLVDFLRRTQASQVSVHAHEGMVNAARVAAITDILHSHNLDVERKPAVSQQSLDVVRLIATAPVVTLPGCPDWTGHPSHTFDNQPTRNFGCATARNLGLMVARPTDLIEGPSTGPADGAVQAAAFARYRAGETKPLAGGVSTEAVSGTTTGGNE